MRCDGAGPDSASPQPVTARASSLRTAISQRVASEPEREPRPSCRPCQTSLGRDLVHGYMHPRPDACTRACVVAQAETWCCSVPPLHHAPSPASLRIPLPRESASVCARGHMDPTPPDSTSPQPVRLDLARAQDRVTGAVRTSLSSSSLQCTQ
jgi:hypothetical protein